MRQYRTPTIDDVCRANAEHILDLGRMSQPGLGFNHAGIEWLDQYIEDHRHNLDADLVGEFVYLAGCFFGECLRSALGGAWEESGNHLGLRIGTHGLTYPMAQVEQQLTGNGTASVQRCYQSATTYLSEPAAAAANGIAPSRAASESVVSAA